MVISLARNGKGIAIAVLGDGGMGEIEPTETALPLNDMAAKSRIIASHVTFTREKFPKENPDNPDRFVDVITTSSKLRDNWDKGT